MMPNHRTAATLERLVARVESASILDAPADLVARSIPDRLRSRRYRELLSGTPAGHPAHPALVSVPMGAFFCASVLDLVGERAAARRLTSLGIASAAPAALTGWNDWLDTEGAERRVGLIHAAANATAISLCAAGWWARRRGGHRGAVLNLAGVSVMSVGGWLGGHLAYALGVGVDTTAFQHVDAEWHDLAPAGEVGTCVHGEVAGTAVMVVRTRSGLAAIADRCTHRGAPLHEGDLVDGRVICPWHGSTFDLASGAVIRGPATRPQPCFDVREVAGRFQVRRVDNRSLRTNPV